MPADGVIVVVWTFHYSRLEIAGISTSEIVHNARLHFSNPIALDVRNYLHHKFLYLETINLRNQKLFIMHDFVSRNH